MILRPVDQQRSAAEVSDDSTHVVKQARLEFRAKGEARGAWSKK